MTGDVAEHDQPDVVVDELLHHLAGEPGAQDEERVVQPVGGHGDQLGTVVRRADEIQCVLHGGDRGPGGVAHEHLHPAQFLHCVCHGALLPVGVRNRT